MSEDNEKITRKKMCAQKDLTTKVVKKVSNKAGVSTNKTKKMRAAFLKSKVWPANTTINVGFLNTFDSEEIPRTETVVLKKKVDRNGVALKLDPIQDEIDNMSIRDAIIYIVSKRFNDITYPEYKPDSVTVDPEYKPSPLINIKFNFFDPTDPSRKTLFNPNLADIRIDFDPDGGAWSLLGTDTLTEDKKNCTMNFGWFDAPTTLHEFCHAIGMVHEHSNPNGKPINWSVCRVSQWANSTQGWDAGTIKDNIIEKYKVDQINGSEFDPLSIMLYFFPGTIVCKDNPDGSVADIKLKDVEQCFSGCKTDPKNGVKACHSDLDKCDRPGNGTAQNLRFSPYDVLYLNNIYPSETQTMTSEQIAVKFFNDNYGEQINPDELSRQLKLTAEREKTGKSGSAAHALKEGLEETKIDSIIDSIPILGNVISLILILVYIFIPIILTYYILKFIYNLFYKK